MPQHTGDVGAADPLVSQNLARTRGKNLTRVPMRPSQLRFHARSEHLVGGAWAWGASSSFECGNARFAKPSAYHT